MAQIPPEGCMWPCIMIFEAGRMLRDYMIINFAQIMSLGLIVSNGLIGELTNIGGTPKWGMILILIFSLASLGFYIYKLVIDVTRANIQWEHVDGFLGGLGWRWVYYVNRRENDTRVPYFKWFALFELLVHISYLVCSVFIINLILTKHQKKDEATIISSDLTYWVLANTGASTILSLISTWKSDNPYTCITLTGERLRMKPNPAIPLPLDTQMVLQQIIE